MKLPKNDPHWLDKAEPKYWPSKGYWRVRIMRDGTRSQWLLKGGKGDSSSTGRAIAYAEWQRIKNEIIRKEMPPEMFVNLTDEQMTEQARYRQWQDEPLTKLPYDEWKEFQDWKRFKLNAIDAAKGESIVVGGTAIKKFSDLTAIFRAHLDHRLSATKPGLKSKQDISQARHQQYVFCLAHLDEVLGSQAVMPHGEHDISEKQLSSLLGKYRSHCMTEMTAKKFSGHWFNERMKTVRSMVSYLVENRLAEKTPANIESLTEKYSIEANPSPIPLNILKAIWNQTDEQFKTYMLLALNCGFRQTEIGSLKATDIKKVSGHLCIVKPRGKTGVPIAIPLWKRTEKAIKANGNKSGPLFDFGGMSGKQVMDKLANRLAKIKQQVAKTMPKVMDYSFENFRDTGATFIDGINPMLTPLYLGQSDKRQAKSYVGTIEGSGGVMPMQMDKVLQQFEKHLGLP